MSRDNTIRPKKRGRRPNKFEAPKATQEIIQRSAEMNPDVVQPTYGMPPPRVPTSTHPAMPMRLGSLIDQYNLTSLVKEMRLKGRSYRDIADYINDSGLLPNQYQVSYSSVVRWCQNHNLTGKIDGEEQFSINAYNENLKLFQIVANAREKVSVMLDDFDKDIKNGDASASKLDTLIKSLDRLTLRQQTLASSLVEMQDKIYRYETVCSVIEQIMAIISVQVTPETYDNIKEILGNDPILCHAITAIKPTNTVN